MAFENCVVTHNTPETWRPSAKRVFPDDGKVGARDLRRVLEELLKDPDKVESYRHKARQRAQSVYSWETVTDLYEKMFYQVRGMAFPEKLR